MLAGDATGLGRVGRHGDLGDGQRGKVSGRAHDGRGRDEAAASQSAADGRLDDDRGGGELHDHGRSALRAHRGEQAHTERLRVDGVRDAHGHAEPARLLC